MSNYLLGLIDGVIVGLTELAELCNCCQDKWTESNKLGFCGAELQHKSQHTYSEVGKYVGVYVGKYVGTYVGKYVG